MGLDHIAHQHLLPRVVVGKDDGALLAEQAKARRGADGCAVDGDFGEVGDRQLAKQRRGREVACVILLQALGLSQQTGAGSSGQSDGAK